MADQERENQLLYQQFASQSDDSAPKTLQIPRHLVSHLAQPVTSSGVLLGLAQVALCILDGENPLLIAEPEFVLGRGPDQLRTKIVDLTPYQGYVFGVSRQHAVISQTASGYRIKDLGSANGTWLNNSRLAAFVAYPLQDKDQVRLGHLLLMVRFVFEDTSPH